MGWQVTAEMVVVPAATPFGTQMVHVNRQGLLPAGVPQDRIKHLLSVKMIREVGAPAPELPDPSGDPNVVSTSAADGVPVAVDPNGGTPDDGPQSTPYDDPARVEARGKLPEDGSAPDGRASKAVLAEWLAGKGYDYDTSIGQDKADLLTLVKQQQPS